MNALRVVSLLPAFGDLRSNVPSVNRTGKKMRFTLAVFAFNALLAATLFGQSNPVPFVNQPLVPATVGPGASAFTLTVNGTGFVSGSVVNWNGSARATTFVNSSQLTATILATDVAVAETGTVTVSSPGPGGGVSNPVYLGVTNPFRQITFASSSFGNPVLPLGMTVADLNGDGKLDLVTSNQNGEVSVFLGNGDGTFQAERDYVMGSTNADLTSITAVDLNRDGKLDLVVCDVGTAQVVVVLGNGDGTFGTPAFYSTNGNLPENLVIGDFNADGVVDIAVTNLNSNTIAVLLGNGDGTLKPGITSAASFAPLYLAAGDFNKDGKLDLVVTSEDESYISVMLGNGDGTFRQPVTYAAGINPWTILTADFNNDGNLDVAVINYNDAVTNTVSVFLGNGDGTLKPYVQFDVGQSPSQMATSDLDGDGKLDLLVINEQGNPTLSVLFGNGDGTFQPQVVFPLQGYAAIVPGDFNGDGRLDLAIADRVNEKVELLTQIPSVNLAPTSLSFPNQIVGTNSSAQTVILTNASNTPLTISSITITGTNANAYVQTNTCPATLNAGANCTISVIYAPPLVESDAATLTVKDSGAPGTQTVALSGNSIGPVVVLSSTRLSFGNQVVGTVSGSQTVILANTGTIPLTITSLATTGNFSQTNTCGTSVAVGGSCNITVRFNPAVIGNRMGAVTIKDNAGPPTQVITLFGIGTDVSLSTTSLIFPPQKVGTTRPPSNVLLTNVGATTLTFSGLTLMGLNAQDFAQTNNCGSSLAAGRSCTIAVTFTPTAKGTRKAYLAITDNGGGSPQKVTLTGTGK